MTDAEKEREDVIAYLRYLDRKHPPRPSWLTRISNTKMSKKGAIIADLEEGLHKNEAYQL